MIRSQYFIREQSRNRVEKGLQRRTEKRVCSAQLTAWHAYYYYSTPSLVETDTSIDIDSTFFGFLLCPWPLIEMTSLHDDRALSIKIAIFISIKIKTITKTKKFWFQIAKSYMHLIVIKGTVFKLASQEKHVSHTWADAKFKPNGGQFLAHWMGDYEIPVPFPTYHVTQYSPEKGGWNLKTE